MTESQPSARRVATLSISDELLCSWFRDGIPCGVQIVRDALPADAKIVGAWFNGRYVVLVFESESFTSVIEGGTPPAFVGPVFRAIELSKLEPSDN